MGSTLIKKIVEEKIEVSENKYENRVQITFESNNSDTRASNTITLSGDGSVKVLLPV